MNAPVAVAASARESHITTAQTNGKPSRAPVIVAALAGLAVLGGATFVMLSGSKKHDDKVAVAPEPVKAEAPPPVEVKPAPVEAKADPAPPPVETNPAEVVAPEPGSAAEPEPKTQPKVTPKATKTTKTTKTQTKAQTTTQPPPNNVTTNVEPPVETKAAPKQVTSSMVASQYQSVGSQLKALQDAKGVDAVSDLWSRYRMIRLVDAMSTQPKRDEAAAVLGKLASEIAARKK